MKNKNTLLLRKSDYDCYKILLPWKSMFSKKRNKYISNELGKQHPCYSDDFSFDTKLSLKKDGIHADVLVISNFKLANYRNRNPGKKIYAEGFGRKNVFSGKKKINTLVIFIAAFVFLISSFCFNALCNENTESEILNDELIENVELGKSVQEFCGDFFEAVRNEKGKLKSFVFDREGFSGKISASVLKMYPEGLFGFSDNLNFSAVSFDKDVSFFSVSAFEKINQNVLLSTDVDNKNEIGLLRELLLKNGCQIKEETVEPCGIIFGCDADIVCKEKLFSEIGMFVLEKKMIVSRISINADCSDYFVIGLVFGKNGFDDSGSVFELIENNKNLFIENKRTETKKIIKNTVAFEEKNQKQEERMTDGKKIGQVIHSDGSVFSFYKNSSGKIEMIDSGKKTVF